MPIPLPPEQVPRPDVSTGVCQQVLVHLSKSVTCPLCVVNIAIGQHVNLKLGAAGQRGCPLHHVIRPKPSLQGMSNRWSVSAAFRHGWLNL